MSTQIRHFVLTPTGDVREFSAEAAASVAAGQAALPEFAHSSIRYVQIALDEDTSSEVRVHTGIASLKFDDDGRFSGAEAPADGKDQIDAFEYDACVQWALHDSGTTELVYH